MAGETVTQVAATAAVFKPLGQTLAGKPVSFEVTDAQTETDDIHVVGYLPAGVTFVGAILKTDDLDSNGSEALVWTLLVGATAFDTATNAAALAGLVMTGDFITTTAETTLYLKSTTAAATAAAGTVNFMPLYVEA